LAVVLDVVLNKAKTCDRLPLPEGLETVHVKDWFNPLWFDGENEIAVGAISTHAWNVVATVAPAAFARNPGPRWMQLPAANVAVAAWLTAKLDAESALLSTWLWSPVV
jgi:hypothetical protein